MTVTSLECSSDYQFTPSVEVIWYHKRTLHRLGPPSSMDAEVSKTKYECYIQDKTD